MIARATSSVTEFVTDPVGAIHAMARAAPRPVHGALALLAAVFAASVIDGIYGPVAFPHTLENGGKRADGPIVSAAIETMRIFGTAGVFYLGAKLLAGEGTTWARALWVTLPFALAQVGLTVLEGLVFVLFLATGLNIYGPMFVIGFGAVALVLVVCARGMMPEADWLGALPLAAAAFVLGQYVPFLVLPALFLFWSVTYLRTRLR